jgi:hypothetical protein
MINLIGDWKALHNIYFRKGNREIMLPKGAIIAVISQHYREGERVLIEMGPANSDWFSYTMLTNNFERLI